MPETKPLSYQIRRIVPTGHPSLPGHFPGDPVVPGVVILDEVVQALTRWRNDYRVTGIPVAKFAVPLRPGQRFAIRLTATGETRVTFSCTVRGRAVAEGRLEIVRL